MNKKIILSISTVAILTTSLFAYNSQRDMNEGCKDRGSKHQMMKRDHKQKRGVKIERMVMQLDLSKKQRLEIREIIQESRKNIPNPYSAFSDTNFDQEKYMKVSNERKDNRIKTKAQTISKIYALLDASQKKDLKTLLDARELMKRNMIIK